MAEPKREEPLANSKFILSVLQWVGPVILGLASGFGSVTFTDGAREQRLINVENKVSELQKTVEGNRERYVSRDELKAYLDGMRNTLDGIRGDVRDLRGKR